MNFVKISVYMNFKKFSHLVFPINYGVPRYLCCYCICGNLKTERRKCCSAISRKAYIVLEVSNAMALLCVMLRLRGSSGGLNYSVIFL